MKRGQSGLSLVVAVDKPSGMSSHDVVNRCRRIFGERRVGHTGTLDPLATGVLPICVGPATRLDPYLTGHHKEYRVTFRFGKETDTHDSQGIVIDEAPIPSDLLDGAFADAYIEGLVGDHEQVPPAHSAIKKDGKRAYELARKGEPVKLEPRPITITGASLLERRMVPDESTVEWVVDLSVSKGTYIRAIVRDIGHELGSYAYITSLVRTRSGSISLEDCVTLDTLGSIGAEAALDPVRLLGFRFLFADALGERISNGQKLSERSITLFEFANDDPGIDCCCTGSIYESNAPLVDGEKVSVIVSNALKAIYGYDAAQQVLRPECVFSEPVLRSFIPIDGSR